MHRKIEVGFADQGISDAFDALKHGKGAEQELYESLNKAFDELKMDPLCGIKVPRKLWPKEYVKKYGIDNLWKYNLPRGWRMTYTLRMEEVCILAVALEWMDHKDYERRFGYRG
ncbi:MAG: hypothetical protein WC350_04915 [Candidatus Micrarchaeia archaeon]|jgi:hypothetical protein